MTDCEFERQVVADATAAGWPSNLAQLLAKHAGRPHKPGAAASRPKARVNAAPNQADEIVATLKLLRLPVDLVDAFREAGVTTHGAVLPMLAPIMQSTNVARATASLRLHLLSRALKRKAAQ